MATRASQRPRFGERGSVMVEYVVLLTVVAIGCMGAMITIGGAALRALWTLTAWLGLSFP